MNNNPADSFEKTSMLTGALVISVIMNLFLLGCLIGGGPNAKGKHFSPMSLSHQHGELMEDRITRYLSPVDEAAFHEAMQPQADALKQAHAHVRDAMKDLAVSYEQNPLDHNALQSALDHLKQAKDEVNDVVTKIILDSSSKLTPDGRHRLAEATR